MSLPKRYVWFAVGAAGAMGLLFLRQKFSEGQDEDTAGNSSGPTQKTTHRSDPKGEKKEDLNLPPGTKELTAFLAGESWFDEMGWNTVWERAGIEGPEAWLKKQGLIALEKERKKLEEQPALLAGCRRRWIVVCRYAGIDVAEAAQLWNNIAS